MSTRILLLVLVASMFHAETLIGQEQPVDTKAVRGAIERALPYLAVEGEKWITKRKCVSCHHTAYLAWTHRVAARHGFNVETAKLDEWTQWSIDQSLSVHKMGGKTGSRNLEGVGQLILGYADTPIPATQLAAFETLTGLIVQGQNPDGTWKAGGQLPLQRRPKEENSAISTIWALLALADSKDALADDAQDKALTAIRKRQESKSNEWWVARLLLEQSYGTPEQIQDGYKKLLAQQHADGGWSWLTGEASDALATGQSLYALKLTGGSETDPPLQKAVHYLLSTQQESGNWLVPTTLERKKGKAIATSNFLGTAWATLALLGMLEE